MDVWAAGIVMYMLTTGVHPFYSKGDSVESYKIKMLNPRFVFPENFPL